MLSGEDDPECGGAALGGHQCAGGRLCPMRLKLGMKVGPSMEPTEGEVRTLRRWPSGVGEGLERGKTHTHE